MEEKSIRSSRGEVYYWISRHRDPGAKALVFLPGLTADHRLFDPQTTFFAQDYTVLTWDAPAHGKSRPYKDFSYPNLARDLKGILDAEGLSRVTLVGQSAGGFVAQSFLRQYPGMVDGFVSIGSCPYGPGYYSRSDFFWVRQTGWMARLFPDGLLGAAVAKMCGHTPLGRENMRRMLECYDKKELCRLMHLGFSGVIPEVAGTLSIPCPVCLIVGEHDRIGRVMGYNRRWHEAEGHPLHLIPAAAHNANHDQPEAVNGVIAAFLRELS